MKAEESAKVNSKEPVPNADDACIEEVIASTSRSRQAEEDQELQELSRFQAKAKARRKSRQKRIQYQFMFKAGAFVIMLTVVMITKKIQEWYKGGTNSSEDKAPSPTTAANSEL
ncbi:unnamed protein product [Symbiodinium necroappetens]|uniref:Uncharacterized protein n=2 Tax=Symbiodinium TaxID=2949 RepID=A0A812NCZ6_9DINO|nr:hypothetical protein AK812_SmicGene30593 [Symbiodinium microadriaticum]CAE7250091.1 unnamed protein product [Symbiodinium sp. KB8]CAE7250783.1 unnamed protein product [Symbiodinium microadriaticum]CAE7307087.1 unnamed protein product [Symbiodinium necroappetens]